MTLPVLLRPVVINPIIFSLPATGFADSDAVSINIPSGRDFIIKSPKTKRFGHVSIRGGRNGILAGLYQTIGLNRDGSKPAQGFRGVGDRNIEILNGDKGRTIHIEGFHLEGTEGIESDGFMLNCNTTIVQLQFGRVEGLQGSIVQGHRHADVLQIGPGGIGELRIDRFTGASHYNTFYCRRENSPLGEKHGPLKFRYVNIFGYKTNPIGSPQGTLTCLSLGTQPADEDGGPGNNASATNGELPNDVYLERFYADHLSAGHLTLGEFMHPDSRKNSYGPAKPIQDSTGGWYWPLWATSNPGVHGHILPGKPLKGDFVKAVNTGLNYRNAMWLA